MRRALIATIIGLTAWTGLAGQQTPPTFRSGVDIVTLDVSVLDEDRRPVRGLTAADFTVIENGTPLPIVAFKAVDLPDRDIAMAPWVGDVGSDVVSNRFEPDRLVVLLLDDWNVSTNPSEVRTTKLIAQAIVDELGPVDLAAVVYTFAHERGVEFTSDKARLRQAIDRFASSQMPEPPARFGMPPMPSMACPHNECVTAAFRAVSDVMRESWPGRRKTVAYVSGEGTYTIGPQPIGDRVTGLTNPGESAGLWDSGPDLQRTFRALQEANVNVYQYDPRDLKESLNLLVAPNTTGQMGIFAANTGGGIVTKTNAPEQHVSEMFIENSSYYMLGVQPPNTPGKTAFRPVTVKVAFPGVVVRTRPGYYTPTAEKTKAVKNPPSPIEKALSGARPTGDLPLSLLAVPLATPKGAAVAVITGLDRDLDMPPTDTIEIAARAFSQATNDRRSKGVATAKLALSRPATAAGVVHYDMGTRLDVAPGQYEIRLAADSAATRLTGSAFAYVTVPDFERNRLSASGLVLTKLPPSSATGKDPLVDLLPFTPTTLRAFGRGERVVSVVWFYQGAQQTAEAVAIAAKIVDQRDETVFERSDTAKPSVFQPTPRTAEYRLELPLADLDPGEYLLTIDGKVGPAAVSRRLRFRMN